MSVVLIPLVSYSLGYFSREYVRDGAWYLGLAMSKYCKRVPYWDSHVEPLIVQGASKLFVALNGLLHGMTSDNEVPLTEEIQQFNDTVTEEITLSNSKDDELRYTIL